jgi:hypothetical protein
VHRGDAVIQLAQRTEQLVDVHIRRPVHGGELLQDVFVISYGPGRRERAVVDQNPIGEKAAQRRLELVMVGVDKPGHDDAAGRVDLSRAARVQVRPNGEDFLAFDQHVGLGKVADLRIQRHHRTAANKIAPARVAAVYGRVVCDGGACRKQIETRSGDPGRNRTLQKIAPRAEMVLRQSRIAQFAHADVSPLKVI